MIFYLRGSCNDPPGSIVSWGKRAKTMKQPLILACLLLMSAFFISCHKSNMNYENDFGKSYQEWLSFKKTSGNSYRYKVVSNSWVGSGWETTLTVTEGKITQRYYKLTLPRGYTGNIPADRLEWTENGNEVNTHTQSGAAAAITLDQVYEKARTEWLLKRQNSKTYFEAKNDGMISSCGYVNDGCADDCFVGINIAYIQAL